MEGTVIKLIGGLYTVLDFESQKEIPCLARGKLRSIRLEKDSTFLKSKTAKTKIEARDVKLSPKVGDHVFYEMFDGTNYIMEIKPRRNELVRPDICNVDQAILIFAAKEPELSLILLDRFLALIERENVVPIIVVSKIDMLSKDELLSLKEMMAYYQKMYSVYFVSSRHNIGVDELEKVFKNKISVLTGQTGVGKSSLLNVLMPGFNLKTQEISQALGRGKHTTRVTSLYSILGGMVADTPGFGSLDYGNMSISEMSHCFIDLFEISHDCKYRGCIHINEPGCAVYKKYLDKEILPSRYENYLRFATEIKNRKVRY